MPDTANGQPFTHDDIADVLKGGPLTEGYKSTIPLWMLQNSDTVPQLYLLRDIELMIVHPVVDSALQYFKGGIAGAEFEGPLDPADPSGTNHLPISDDPAVSAFCMEQCQRFWDKGVPKLQGGYEYGWIGCETLYADTTKGLAFDDLIQFSPRDVYRLTRDRKQVGVRVKNVEGQGSIDLWTGTHDVPAKGLWYAHNPRYSQYYGRSQLLSAWRPWRRLAWKDGAETNIDGGFYRSFYAGPLIKYPEEDYQAAPGSPATSLDSQGRPRRYARDVARQLAEWYKSGAGVGLPSTKYPVEMGGGDKWDMTLHKGTLNVEGGVQYVKYLQDLIRLGIGVPPELMEAAETGSGYSGRAIPLEAWLDGQQRLADAMLTLFVREVLAPLVRWNFGPVRFDVKVRRLLETKRKAQGQGEPVQSGKAMGAPDTGGPQSQPGGPPDILGGRGTPPGMTPGAPAFSLNPFLINERIQEISRRVLMASRRAA